MAAFGSNVFNASGLKTSCTKDVGVISAPSSLREKKTSAPPVAERGRPCRCIYRCASSLGLQARERKNRTSACGGDLLDGLAGRMKHIEDVQSEGTLAKLLSMNSRQVLAFRIVYDMCFIQD